MYQIIKNGEIIATTEELHYIKRSGTLRNGEVRFVHCAEKEAEGIAVNGMAYSFLGRTEIPGFESVTVFKIDGGASVHKGENQQNALASLVVDLEYRTTLFEMGVTQ